MMKSRNKWLFISLINLSIVAFLGILLRAKILFTIPMLDFKFLIHAHSHFAFGGWVTLALLTLMTFELLPEHVHLRKTYRFCILSILITSAGMLISFLYQGYGAFSIAFSTLFIFLTYYFSWIFLVDFLKLNKNIIPRLLVFSALICLVLSSVGPFSLGYLIATKTSNPVLYKDAIYTYLHLQYNGFFTLAVFALVYQRVLPLLMPSDFRVNKYFVILLVISILPSLFLSYLWQYPHMWVRIIAGVGSFSLLLCCYWFTRVTQHIISPGHYQNKMAFRIIQISMAAFFLKMMLQVLTIIPWLGSHIFSNRPVIIAFLHLVFLCFVTLYILGYLLETGFFKMNGMARLAVWTFVAGVLANEAVLLTQGLGFMFLNSSSIYPYVLLGVACWLFAGACMIVFSAWRSARIS